MKRLNLFSIALVACISIPLAAQSQTTHKEAQKELKSRVVKDSKNQAKEYEKQGWMTMAGGLTMERQIENSNIATIEENEKGEKVWVVAQHRAVGGNYSAAKLIATTRAKAQIASAIETKIKEKTYSKLSNKNLGDGEVKVIDEIIEAIMTEVDTTIKGVNTTLEIYKSIDGGKYEVEVGLAADYATTEAEVERRLVENLNKSSMQRAKEVAELIKMK